MPAGAAGVFLRAGHLRRRAGAATRDGRPRTTLAHRRCRRSDGPAAPGIRRRDRAFRLVRSPQSPLTPPRTTDVLHVIQAALDGVSATRVIARAFDNPEAGPRLNAGPMHVLAVGKAAPAMATALMARADAEVRSALAIGTHPSAGMPADLTFIAGSHPYPDQRSRDAAREALAFVGRLRADEHLALLISGGASALMAEAADGLSFDDKQAATRAFMHAGADIHQLNALRRHLSAVKGGSLAAACAGAVTTLALSDVVGDDLHAIGSGPGVPDPSTWNDVARAVDARAAMPLLPPAVQTRIADGLARRVPDTPKPGDSRLARAAGFVVGRAADAVESAAVAARQCGFTPVVLDERVTGEAREVAVPWLHRALVTARLHGSRVCVISAGETTVRVRGSGVGGRNLEFVLALTDALGDLPGVVAASVGTDGVDGTSGVAGAWADHTTAARAAAHGLPSAHDMLDRNDSFNYFNPLGDTIRTGPTDTNVGDLQLLFVTS
ncbi:MAG: DUF4147 domain-containing protein [Acidobacteria bacterium]|nr:DUF4147 domain-containing protein [Acidobacteriota bacterium]